MESIAKEIRILFNNFNQEQVFQFWEILNNKEKEALLLQSKSVDLDYLSKVIHGTIKKPALSEDSSYSIIPANFIHFPKSEADWQKWKDTVHVGQKALRDGRVAVLTVAGGQGTRLGCVVPKGTIAITPIKKKSLFQVFAEKIKAAEKKYDKPIHWFVMTSDRNHNETLEFFGKHNSFDINNIHFIKQGMIPAVDNNGKIIMETRSKIAMHPDGHGGSLRAMISSGSIAMLENIGVDIISYSHVDNPLVRLIDPYLIGLHVKNTSQVTSRMVKKLYPEEKVGVFCEKNGHHCVVEYIDMPKEQAMLRDASGNLKFCAGNVGIHLFDIEFVKKVANKHSTISIPYHIARKIIPTIDMFGEPIIPDSPNGIKLEQFVFDAFPFAYKFVVVESKRSETFSPIKNMEGIDSPETCRQSQLSVFAHWLLEAGVDIHTDANGLPPFDIEISPLFADNEKDFLEKWASLVTKPAIGPGQYIE